MKSVQITIELPDFCPESCKEMAPFNTKGDKTVRCLHGSTCEELWKHIRKESRRRAEKEEEETTP